jgi:hypothetical protein
MKRGALLVALAALGCAKPDASSLRRAAEQRFRRYDGRDVATVERCTISPISLGDRGMLSISEPLLAQDKPPPYGECDVALDFDIGREHREHHRVRLRFVWFETSRTWKVFDSTVDPETQ